MQGPMIHRVDLPVGTQVAMGYASQLRQALLSIQRSKQPTAEWLASDHRLRYEEVREATARHLERMAAERSWFIEVEITAATSGEGWTISITYQGLNSRIA